MNIEQKTDAGTRLGSMLLDHFVMTFIGMFFFIPGMIINFATVLDVSHDQPEINLFGDSIYIFLIGFAIYLCKDSFNGRSPAKRVLKLQVVDNATGRPASPVKCFARNIFCIIWPLEVIVTLVSPSRRLGDMAAGTKVVPFDQEVEQPAVNYGQVGFAILLAYGLMILLTLPLQKLQTLIDNAQVSYIESSYNETLSRETEQLFADSLGSYLTADVQVYDQINQDEEIKYVSVILRLDENYLEYDSDFEEIKSITIPVLLSKFPEGSFVGQIKYVYQTSTSMTTRHHRFDLERERIRREPDHVNV